MFFFNQSYLGVCEWEQFDVDPNKNMIDWLIDLKWTVGPWVEVCELIWVAWNSVTISSGLCKTTAAYDFAFMLFSLYLQLFWNKPCWLITVLSFFINGKSSLLWLT